MLSSGAKTTTHPQASYSSRRSLPKPARTWEQENQKAFTGPMSSASPFQQGTMFLDDRRGSLSGKSEEDEEEEDGSEELEDPSSPKSDEMQKSQIRKKKNSQFLYLEYEVAKRLINVYESEINSMSPIFEVHELDAKYEEFQSYYRENNAEYPDTRDVSIIKLVLAIATGVTETYVKEGRMLYEEVLSMTEWRIVAGTADIYTLISVWLIHNYQFHTDMESLAYRTICFAAVLAIELGLHQSSKMEEMFPDPVQRERYRALFWCIYVVDRRLAFSTGRPHVLREADIDQELPKVVESSSDISQDTIIRSLYLNAMVVYTKVAGRVWNASSNFKPPNQYKIDTEELNYIEFLISRWYSGLPQQLRLCRPSDPNYHPPPNLSRKLQVILYLRYNLMFLHLYRPVLFSNRTIAEHMPYAFRAVEIALDSIRELFRLRFESDLYASCQIHYNYFLLTALGVLFTAIIHAPNVFAALCKREFDKALDLIKLFSKVSNVGKRLWATVKRLRSVTHAISKTSNFNSETWNSLDLANTHQQPHQQLNTASPVIKSPSLVNDIQTSAASSLNDGMTSSALKSSLEADPEENFNSIRFGVQSQIPKTESFNTSVNDIQSPMDYSSTSSIDGLNLSSEVSDLFSMVTGDVSNPRDVDIHAAPSASLPIGYYPNTMPNSHLLRHVYTNQMPITPQYAPIQQRSTGGSQVYLTENGTQFAPLGMEASLVAQMLTQGARNDAAHDNEVFKLIENLF